MDIQTGIEKGREVVAEFKRMRLIGEHHALGPCNQMAEIIAAELVANVVDVANAADERAEAAMLVTTKEMRRRLEAITVAVQGFANNINYVGPNKAAELFLETAGARMVLGRELEETTDED